MSDALVRTTAAMGTVVTVEVVGSGENASARTERERCVAEALEWFGVVEAACTRFDPASELMQLTAQAGVAVPVSAILYEAVRFALVVAEASDGAFDPTVGRRMEARGFNREHRTGRTIHTPLDDAIDVSWRDVVLGTGETTITLVRPLILDLGAVAKGMAVDLAARALNAYPDFVVDAGGDLYLAGRNRERRPWSVGIRHPRRRDALIETVHVSGMAVCTSGDYERLSADPSGHHIMDARTGRTAEQLASVTAIAPSAMLADALGTAAFVLGPARGTDLLERNGADGLLVTPRLERFSTPGFSRYAQGAMAELRGE